MNEENIKLIFHFQIFHLFVECSLQAAGHGLRDERCEMRVISRSITQQNVRKHFCVNESEQGEQNKGPIDKFEILKLN